MNQTENDILNDGIHNYTDPKNIDWEKKPNNIKRRIEWFKDLKLGFFIHFGLYTQAGVLESWPLSGKGDPWAVKDDPYFHSKFNGNHEEYAKWYKSLITEFNPKKFEAKYVVDFVEKIGAKYFNITTKHHDGFCLWDTKTTDFKITSNRSPYKKDIIKDLYSELRTRDIPIWAYFSKPDWNSEYYWSPNHSIIDRNVNYDVNVKKEEWKRYQSFVFDQIDELVSNYGKIDCLWLDGGWVRKSNNQDILLSKIVKNARTKNNPDMLIADRTVGGDFEDFVTPEGEIPNHFIKEPWETCITLTKNWSASTEEEVKSTKWFVDNFLQTISYGGNLLLGIGLQKDGLFYPEVKNRIEEIGEWVHKNSEYIFKTRPLNPYSFNKSYFLSKADKIIIFANKEDNKIAIPSEWGKLRVISGNAKINDDKNIIPTTNDYLYDYMPIILKRCKEDSNEK